MSYRIIAYCLLLLASPVNAEPLLFLSTQGVPAKEAREMRQVVLKGFKGDVDFQPYDSRPTFFRLARTSDSNRPSLVGGLHADLAQLAAEGQLENLDFLLPQLKDRQIVKKFVQLGRIQNDQLYYIPWMQATYLMVANRRALQYMPAGANINRLTYAQLATWANNLHSATGTPKLGFPAGPGGLMHRFFQGYLYPSYTGTTVRGFRSPEAKAMWQDFKNIWREVNPRSLTFDSMHQPLSSGEVWIAWDHTARILPAIEKNPQDFVAFPAPAGPHGRGFMVVLAGLALSTDAPQRDRAIRLIDFLSQPDTQLLTLRSIGFFPVSGAAGRGELSAGLKLVKSAVTEQASAEDAVPALLPMGLGEEGQEFNTAYKLTFSQIILRKRPIAKVLDSQASKISALLKRAGASCWPPDKPSQGSCPIK